MKNKITVEDLNRSYDIIIENNSITNLSSFFDVRKQMVLISDENVYDHYGDLVSDQLNDPLIIVIEPGENNKSFENVEGIISEMLDANISRDATIIALGGGVVGDLAGFIASIYMRGIDYINIPTSTLAQIDSSVGSKVAINVVNRKNSVGSFYDPKLVLIDPLVCGSLPFEHYYAGLVEAVKIGITSNEHLLKLLLKSTSIDAYPQLVMEAIKTKLELVKADKYDHGARQILNFGHTLAHALEIEKGLIHGEAVIYGMALDHTSKDIQDIIETFKQRFNFNQELTLNTNILNNLYHDKKRVNESINLVVVDEVGKGTLKAYSLDDIKERCEHVYAWE
ncbi:MAG: 3-dehydroquinate synthase [Erysipelothrix sp.]|nr:3-dehydroquinate synthase [Erysipelothrix sp.]